MTSIIFFNEMIAVSLLHFFLKLYLIAIRTM